MPIGCLICDEPLESSSPVVPDPPSLDTGAGTKAKKAKGTKRPPATANDNVVTPCGHMFHELCLVQWFKNKSSTTCPVCRKALTKGKLSRVFPSVVEDDTQPATCNTESSASGNKSPRTAKETTNSESAIQGAAPVPSSVPSSSSNAGPLTGVIKWAPNGKWSYQSGALQPLDMSYQTTSQHSRMQSIVSQYRTPTLSALADHLLQYPSVSNTGNTTSAPTPTTASSSRKYYGEPTLPHQISKANPSTSTSTSQSRPADVPPSNSFIQPYVNVYYPPYPPPFIPLQSYLPSQTIPPSSTSTTQPGQSVPVASTNPRKIQIVRNDTIGAGPSFYSMVSSSSSQPLNSIASASTSTSSNQAPVSGNSKSTITPAVEISRNHSSSSSTTSSGRIQYRTTNNMGLNNHRYDELHVIHQTLVADYNELQQKYNDSQDEVQLLKAQLESSKDEIKRLQESTTNSKANQNQRTTGQTSSNQQTRPNPSTTTTTVVGVPATHKRSHDGTHLPNVNFPTFSTYSPSAGGDPSSVNAPSFNYLARPSMIHSGPWTFYNPYLPRPQQPAAPSTRDQSHQRRPTPDAQATANATATSRIQASSPPIPVLN